MCGILIVFGEKEISSNMRELAYEKARLLRHRGPEETGLKVFKKGVMVHERLSLVGLGTGRQPFMSPCGRYSLIANCEIYNWRELAEQICSTKGWENYEPRSDADVILALYVIHGDAAVGMLRGMFAFVIYDTVRGTAFVARDPVGIIPLYVGEDSDGHFWIVSEMKAIVGVCSSIVTFEPGTFATFVAGKMEAHRYYSPGWINAPLYNPVDLVKLRTELEQQVRQHLPEEVGVAAFLSGGLDSSLVAAIAQRELQKKGAVLATYSIGIEDSPDLKFAAAVARFIGSKHTEVVYTIEEGLDAIKEVVWYLDSYDVTTVRASVPMYLLARKVKKDGYKVVLSGEGADELFGGYLYFHKAPSGREFHDETAKRVLGLSYSDCLRANKSTLAWGVELRVPFLGTDFINYVMSIAPEDRMIPSRVDEEGRGCEKYILRKAFQGSALLPSEVLWRQKEQFSDGVGYAWIDSIKRAAEMKISSEELEETLGAYTVNPPTTKEALYIRKIYQELFGSVGDSTVRKWTPRVDWGCSEDPSGRSQAVHIAPASE